MTMKQLDIKPYGHYGLIERIGSGGMAEIFLAVSEGVEGFRKLVAVKRIHEHYALNERFRQMFINEAKLAALLHHPNAVQIYDLGQIDGQLFIAMEYIAGVDLSRMLQACATAGTRMPVEAVLFICSEILRGLDYAHKKRGPGGAPLSLIHRDVSPSNILVSTEGIVKLCDFGIAKAAHVASFSQEGMLKGKVCYMAPETVRGEAIDHRVDIWAAGTVLWESLAVRRLYPGKPDYLMMERIAAGERTKILEARPDLSPAIAEVVERALAHDREQRFQSAGEMANAIHRAAAGLGLLLTPDALHDYMQAHVIDTLVEVQNLTNAVAAMPREELSQSLGPKPSTVFTPAAPLEQALAAAAEGGATMSLGPAPQRDDNAPATLVDGVEPLAPRPVSGTFAQPSAKPVQPAASPAPPATSPTPPPASPASSVEPDPALDAEEIAAPESQADTAPLPVDRPDSSATIPLPAVSAAEIAAATAVAAASEVSEQAAVGSAAGSATPSRSQRRRHENGTARLAIFAVAALALAGLIWLFLVETMGGPPAPPAALEIETTPPGASVTDASGTLLGATPFRTEELPAGTHRLEVALAGFAPQQLELSLTEGKLERRVLVLIPGGEDGGAAVADAQIATPAAIDAGPMAPDAGATTDSQVVAIAVSDATAATDLHKIVDAQRAQTRDVGVAAKDAGTTADVGLAVVDTGVAPTVDAAGDDPTTPKGPRGWITVWSKPPAHVYVDGKRIGGTTPLFNQPISAGKRTLKVENPHLHRSVERSIQLRRGQRLKIQVDLNREPPVMTIK